MACLVGNTATFFLFALGLVPMLFAGLGVTALPLIVGHLGYERIVAARIGLQTAIIVLAVGLCFGGLFRQAEARQLMVARAAATPPHLIYRREVDRTVPLILRQRLRTTPNRRFGRRSAGPCFS